MIVGNAGLVIQRLEDQRGDNEADDEGFDPNSEDYLVGVAGDHGDGDFGSFRGAFALTAEAVTAYFSPAEEPG